MVALKLYNSLTKRLEEFIPNEPNQVKMYICGPTVYDSPHIGHARTYISFDVIRRLLSGYFGYNVTFVMNITDIDDKIIIRSAERGITCDDLTARYESEFFTAMKRLNVLRPDFVTRVTDYIEDTIKFVEKLEDNGLAYARDGSVYFDLTKYKDIHSYNLLRPAVQGGEEDAIQGKKSREDFALWKASKENEPRYETRWGPGRPGWHIECSAMSSAIFGPKLDIHAGGIDLAFPHHENEIAQCQGYFGEKWVNYFLHTGHLNISGCKMSKSLKNFLTIDDILDTCSPSTLRMLFLQHLWNKDMDYDVEQLKEAETNLKKLLNFVSVTESISKNEERRPLDATDKHFQSLLEEQQNLVHEAFSTNFNIPKALSSLLSFVSSVNAKRDVIHSDVLRMINKHVVAILELLGLLESQKQSDQEDEAIADILNEFRSSVRNAAKRKDGPKSYFELCDRVRADVQRFGYVIDDGSEKSIIRKLK